MQKNKAIIYIDPSGKEHDALVTAINQMHDGVISVIYAVDNPDNKGALQSTTVEVYDIPHMSAQSEVHTVLKSGEAGLRGETVQQGNPDLPTYHIHCWKEAGEDHKALPGDHPAFDGKYAWPKADEHGVFPQVRRPEFEADQAAHLGPVAQPDGSGDSIDDEPTVTDVVSDYDRGYIKAAEESKEFIEKAQAALNSNGDRVGRMALENELLHAALAAQEEKTKQLQAQIDATPKPFGQIVAEIATSAQPETDVATQLDQAGQDHKALPEDHPAFDGKYAWPQADEHGHFAQKARPAFEADQAALAQPDVDPGDSIDDEPTVSALTVGTKHYSDGSSATGVLPLPNRSPAQQDADVATQLDQAGQAPSEPQGEADPPVA